MYFAMFGIFPIIFLKMACDRRWMEIKIDHKLFVCLIESVETIRATSQKSSFWKSLWHLGFIDLFHFIRSRQTYLDSGNNSRMGFSHHSLDAKVLALLIIRIKEPSKHKTHFKLFFRFVASFDKIYLYLFFS